MLLKTKSFILLVAIGASASYGADKSLLDLKRSSLKDSSLKLFFKSDFINQDSQLNKANQFQVKAGADYSLKINNFTTFDIVSAIKLEAGNSNSLFNNNEFEAKNDISLGKAELKFDVTENVTIKAGAISQEEIEHDLLIARSAFVGLSESFKLKGKTFEFKISAQQTIPNNRNYSNRLDKVEEGTAKFFTESVSFKYKLNDFEIKSISSHFAFDNLSNSVAAISRYNGNSVRAFDSRNGEFLYSYIGWAQTLKGSLSITNNFSLSSKIEYVENTAAPEKNKANAINLAAHLSTSGKEYVLSVEKFKNEADASVAFYGSSRYRKNNAEGSIVSAMFFDHKDQIKVEMGYISSKEIEENSIPNTRDEDKIVFIMLGKAYDIF